MDFEVGDKIDLLDDEVMEITRIVDNTIQVEFRDMTRRWYSKSYLIGELKKILPENNLVLRMKT